MLAIMRRAAGRCLLVVMSACGEEPSLPLPAAPTVSNVPTPTFTLSGVITERFSAHPVEGARISVFPFQTNQWPPSGPPLQMTPSDGAGRYSISGLPSVGPVWVVAWPDGNAFSAH